MVISYDRIVGGGHARAGGVSFGKRIARGLSSQIVSGSSDGNFQSIITTATAGVTSADPTTLTYQDFVGLYSKLDPAYVEAASFIMNSTTRGLIFGLTDTLGRPLFVPSVNTDSLDNVMWSSVSTTRTSRPALSALFSSDRCRTHTSCEPPAM
jgi:HK97 family phage major capsid protein